MEIGFVLFGGVVVLIGVALALLYRSYLRSKN
jgi:hypothetical protein